MRVLLVTPYLPHARVGHGGGSAVRDMCRHLARIHELHVASLVRPGEEGLVAATADELGCRIVPVPFTDAGAAGAGRLFLALDRSAALLRSLVRGTPYYVEKYRSARLARALVAIARDVVPDVIQVEYLQMSLLTRELRRWRDAEIAAGRPAPRLCASTHELGSVPRERRAARTASPLRRAALRHQAAAWRRLQRDATTWADISFCVTDDDRAILEADGGVNCVTVPLGADIDAIRPDRAPEEPPILLFVGSFGHEPNVAAARFLVDKVWPQVAKYSQDVRLDIVGRGSEEFLRAAGVGDQRIRALGFVDDLGVVYGRSRLFVAPLPVGGGIKIKILEAMARGIPVVTTPVGAEGITAPDDGTAWIAPPDDGFADAVIEALARPDEADERAARGRLLMEQRFSWRAIAETLTGHYMGGR